MIEKDLAQMHPGADPDAVGTFGRVYLLMLQRKFHDALAILKQLPGDVLTMINRKSFLRALFTLLNDKEKARSAFQRARPIPEKALQQGPDDASRHVCSV